MKLLRIELEASREQSEKKMQAAHLSELHSQVSSSSNTVHQQIHFVINISTAVVVGVCALVKQDKSGTIWIQIS